MPNKDRDLKDIFRLIGSWITEIRLSNAIDYLDINKVSEGFAGQLLNLLFGYELVDLNKIQRKFPGLDLGDLQKTKVAFQVTSRVDTAKIISSLKTSVKQTHHLTFTGGLKFLILREGQKVKFPKSSDPKKELATFDKDSDILYPEDLSVAVEKVYDDDYVTFLKLKTLVERELQFITRERPDDIQSSVNQLTALLEQKYQGIIDSLGARDFIYATFENAELPALNVLGRRQKLTDSYYEMLNARPVLWLNGVSGIGKSSLAWLIAERHEKKYWLDFREITPANLSIYLLKSLCNSLSVPPGSLKETLATIFDEIGAKGVLVLNDLPDLALTGTNSVFINTVVNEALKKNVRILVTSNFQPTLSYDGLFSKHTTVETVPVFSVGEIAEVLSAYGAPADAAGSHAASVKILSEGYPVVVNSMAAYLRDMHWQMDSDVINNIFKNNYADQLNHEIYGKIIASTEDGQTLDLLYRTRLIVGTFGRDELDAVAGVQPAIPHPHQKFERLKGIWIQATQPYKFQVSPLVKRLHSNLSPSTEKHICLALAESLIKPKTLDQIQISKALNYFISAESFMDAAMMLVLVLREALENPSLFFDWGFNLYWFYTPIPLEINAVTRIYIRVLQINICIAANEDYQDLLDDVRQILANEDVDPRAVALANMLFYKALSQTDPATAMAHLVAAHRGNNLKAIYGSEDNAINEERFENSIWLTFVNCKKANDFEGWFGQLKELDFPKNTFNPATDQAYVAAGLSIYINLIAGKKTEEAPEVLTLLLHIAGWSMEAGLDLLAVYSIRNLMIVLCADFGLFDEAESLLGSYRELTEGSVIYKFLIYDEFGRQLMSAGKKEKASYYLSQVVDLDLPDLFTEKVTTYRIYGQLLADDDPVAAHTFTLRSLEFVLGNKFFPPIEQVKLYGEAGISYWLSGDLVAAMDSFELGYDLLHKTFDGSPANQAQVIRFGSIANYIAQIALTGVAPTETENGPYAVPKRGSFFFTNDVIHESGMFNAERRYITGYLFQNYYERLDNYDRARKWAVICIQLMLEVPDPRFVTMLHSSLLYLIKDREYKKAFDVFNFIKSHYKPLKLGNASASRERDEVAVSETLNQNDAIFYNFLFIPLLFNIIPDIMEGSIPESGQHEFFTKLFDGPELEVVDKDTFTLAKTIINKALNTNTGPADFDLIIKDCQGQYVLELTMIGYLMFGIRATAKEAANLQLSIVNRLDALYVNPFGQVYLMLVAPFFERFWLAKAHHCREEFYDFAIWESESVPRFQGEVDKKRVKKLFQTLAYHLDLELPTGIRNWIKNTGS